MHNYLPEAKSRALYQQGGQTMTQQCAPTIPELKSLIEQLCLSRAHLEQLLDQLSGLTTRADLANLSPASQERTDTQQEKTLQPGDQDPATSPPPQTNVIAADARMQIAAGLARAMAQTDAAVLIQGATGTGKNFFAKLIHHHSQRAQYPLITIPSRQFNQPDPLSHIETFLDEAGKGSLILEDIDELQPAAQEHLAKMLNQPLACRLISLSCNDPDELVRHGYFSALLLEQLRECYIALPLLAGRGADIEQLARYYCQQFCAAAGVAEKQLSPEYLNLLTLYAWPGNVRELINTLEQSLLCAGEQKNLYAKDLPAHIRIQTLHLSSARKKGL
ncbi:sigma 54-interacting transcriptional regulator [Pelovirga terrestris]|uniref:Sigma 54-interacting transcriptional regulator n=1 Tax=Pelovirga terrestris TaxID=2771352 RepID=A0A8J6UIU2_9BACT|nr:sigma 54-interacting transcriptional regulator [Pelovirga terrestris]MBD1401730.1 sigma 54-interacting transcriptional regulator [Pelovirga terrestris]